MIHKSIGRFVPVLLVVLMLLSVVSAFAANNIVPSTRLTDQAQAVTANALKPASCSALTLTRIEFCGVGNCIGSNASELILGTAGNDDIRGKKGDDCIIGGGGDDQIFGDQDMDVCIGGPGADTLDNVECETRIQ
jgi:Ca2+-binding RTX toxin-like protein